MVESMLGIEPHLHVRLVGRFALTDNGGEPVVLRNRRARGLLAYLLLAPDCPVGRDRLRGLFWGDRGEPQARASLRQCLSELRTALPAMSRTLLVVERDSVRMPAAGIETDTLAMRKAIQDLRSKRLSQLLRQAGAGRLLEDADLPGAFAEWRDQAQAQFDRELMVGVRTLIKESEAQADWPAVRDLAESYLARDPVDEIVAAALIRADTALGDRPSARRHLAELRNALGKAFGAEPVDRILFDPTPSAESPKVSQPSTFARSPTSPNPPDLPQIMVAEFDTALLDVASRPLGRVLQGELVAGLSGFREFRVVSAETSLQGGRGDMPLNGRLAYELDGTLWGSATGVRLTAQLVRVADRHVIWSERFKVSNLEINAAVDRIITRIVGAVSPAIDADLETGGVTGLGDQYARYVAARGAAAAPADYDAARRAAAELEGLIAEHPGFVLPYLPLARLYNNDFAYTRPLSSGPAERVRAFELARAALSRARGHVHAYTVIGWCYLRQGRWDSARDHFEQALALNPFHADRVMEIGYGFLLLGDLDRASELLHRCLTLNPTPKDSYYIDLALLEMLKSDHDAAARMLGLVAKPMA